MILFQASNDYVALLPLSAAALQLRFCPLLSSGLRHLQLHVHHAPAFDLCVVYMSMNICLREL